MTVTLMQTADAIFYYPMLAETSKTVRAFCARNGFAYEQYVGIKRGHMPWQASYNRVYMLKEMIDRGVSGWVLYLDADAFIRDLDFDLKSYLDERSGSAAIFAGYSSCETPYDINSGGFALNLSDPIAKSMVLDWHRSVDRIPDEIFDRAIDWSHDLANDQHLLWHVLHSYVEERRIKHRIIFERANQSYVNNGPFISQYLRFFFDSFPERLDATTREVARIMADEPDLYGDEGPGTYIVSDHPSLITGCGRKTRFGIETVGVAGGLLGGPFLYLEAGRYRARIFGTAMPGTCFRSDVTARRGQVVLAGQEVVYDRAHRGFLTEMAFCIDKPTHEIEARVAVGADAEMRIHGIQIIRDRQIAREPEAMLQHVAD